MEDNYLTDLRTAATSAVATDLLAASNARTLGVFGSGRQAEAHLSVLARVRSFERFLVCGSGKSDLRSFCGKMKQVHGLEVEAVPAETCAREADVICACTTSPVPVFDGRWLRPGTHLNLVGAFQPHTREVDDDTIRQSRVVVDTYEGALEEAGDLLIPMKSGVIGREHIVADLHELAVSKNKNSTRRKTKTIETQRNPSLPLRVNSGNRSFCGCEAAPKVCGSPRSMAAREDRGTSRSRRRARECYSRSS